MVGESFRYLRVERTGERQASPEGQQADAAGAEGDRLHRGARVGDAHPGSWREARAAYEPPSAMSDAWSPRSTTRPRCMTRIWSAPRTALRRCDTTIRVH